MPRIEYGDTVYCSVEDVSRRFRKDGAFDTDSNPSDAEVLEFIREASARIDRYTYHAWRENRVNEEEKRFDGNYKWGAGRAVKLTRMGIRTPFDSGEGDKIEVWTGNRWKDWLADDSRTEGRENDYWYERHEGVLWLYKRFIWWSGPQLRITYRYGEDVPTETQQLDDGTEYEVITQPHDIIRACSMLTAIELYNTDTYSQLVPGGEGSVSPESTVQHWEDDIYGSDRKTGILERHKIEPMWVEPL